MWVKEGSNSLLLLVLKEVSLHLYLLILESGLFSIFFNQQHLVEVMLHLVANQLQDDWQLPSCCLPCSELTCNNFYYFEEPCFEQAQSMQSKKHVERKTEVEIQR